MPDKNPAEKFNEAKVTATGLDPRTIYFLNEHSTISLHLQISRLLRARSSLTVRQL